MPRAHGPAIEAQLRLHGPRTALQLAEALGVSQPTISRAIASLGDDVVRLGRARSARYVLARPLARAGDRWPLHRIDADGRPHTLGELRALHGDRFQFTSTAPRPVLLQGEFRDGLFPGLPWFLDDQRPQGFLGRQLAHRVAADIGAVDDPLRWTPDDIVLCLLRYGDDAPGDLVLGDTALQSALQHALAPQTIDATQRQTHYPILADAALRGEIVGSSAAGEQPKFAIILRDGDSHRPVIVKFSERSGTPAGRRWADLLRCEHLAAAALRAHGQPAAESQVFEADGRVFLESTRFDRTPALGRRGFVSLAALDAAFYGHGRIDWWRFAPLLQRDGWLDAADAQRLAVLGWFGTLIANADMHLGNSGLHLADAAPLALVPAYDMLPMAFRPASNGELVARDYAVVLPTPEQREPWQTAAVIALAFWSAVADDPRISVGFHAIARGAHETLRRALDRLR
ncbi:type II toxin-antitoxin system HipA family toxin YjjJ [Chiayiivirga flava]|uniref:DNA-binding transcriptional ArsR family regulator n=1 Tax=Chiayiivirga flava TaxID=659595 RepID=A0A7W8G2S6_9GAMM|nr:type II toxin-antitoxin system HipA family toxin YjjJ [Chiayiivirga flava]MBB5209015.1 DNA-binding transcriptional ArsR family regulator [Chiayiivirga flava]